MSGLLGTYAPLWSNVNLVLQLVILTALGGGTLVVKRKQPAQHGYMMAACVALNMASIILVMVPVARGLLGGGQLTQLTGLTALHAAAGVAVEAAAVYLVSVWRFRKPGPACFRYRGRMRALAVAWTLEVALGSSSTSCFTSNLAWRTALREKWSLGEPAHGVGEENGG